MHHQNHKNIIIINSQHSLISFQSGASKYGGTFIRIQSPSTIIINNCHTRCTDDDSLIILNCYEFSLNKYPFYEYTLT